MPPSERSICACLVVLVTFSSMSAFALTDPVAYFSFDNGFNGVGSNGESVRARPLGSPVLVPGRVGNALKAGPLSGQIEIDTTGLVTPRAGTVEMWVMPVDWQSDDGKFHVFFQTRAIGALYLYKYFEGSRLLMLGTDDADDGPFYSSGTEVNWKPGEWHHLAGSWSGDDGVLLFIDGKPLGKVPVPAVLQQSVGKTMTIGDSPWHSLRLTSSLVDEVRVYDRVLTPQEILKHYSGDYSRSATVTKEGATLDYAVDSQGRSLTARLRTTFTRERPIVSVWFSLTPSPTGENRGVMTKIESDGVATGVISISGLTPGRYQLQAEISEPGKASIQKSVEVAIPRQDWLNRQQESQQNVPAPWTAPEYVNGAVRVWGRRYQFQSAALPVQISTATGDMLSGPIALQVTAGGAPITLIPQSQKILPSESGDSIVINTRLTSNGSRGPALAFDVSARIEFDGMVWISISPEQQSLLTRIDELSLEIPMKASRALYRHRWAPQTASENGQLSRLWGTVDSGSFMPFYWLGDDDSGLFWFSETARSWPNASSNDALRVVRSNGQVSLVLKIKSRGQSLVAPWKYEFGIQATPVKPMAAGWRRWRLAPAVKPRFSVLWPAPEADSFKYYGYPESADQGIFSARLANVRQQGMEPMPYICPTYISTASPEWKFFRAGWSMQVFDSTSNDVLAYGAPLAMISPRAPGTIDFMSSRIGDFVRQNQLQGIYFDNVQPYGGFAPEAGVGYLENGKRMREYPILAYRTLFKKIRSEVLEASPTAMSLAHMSGKVAIPVLAFVDAYLDGEQFRGVVKDNYLDLMTLEAFRAEFIGRQWGLAPIFLPEFSDEAARRTEPTRGLMALLMLHDVGVWPMWSNVGEVNRALGALHSFGYEDAEFRPYFSPQPPAHTELDNVYVSAYQKGEQWLLIIGNLSTSRRRGSVCLEDRVIARPTALRFWPSGPRVTLDGSRCLDVDLAGQDYRLVKLTASSSDTARLQHDR